MNTVKEIRQELKNKLSNSEFVIDKSGVKTIEIMNASFIADEPTIFGKLNTDYINRELEWYKSCSLNINDIPGEIPAVWKQIAGKSGKINSNYGWCIWSKDNGNQFNNIITTLASNPNTRQANMIYTRPSIHTDYNADGMSDFICTNNVQYLIRNNKLNSLVYMRSNDAIFGYKNDWAWQMYVLKSVLNELNSMGNTYKLGKIYWNVSSLHVYERHFNLVV